MFEGNKGRNGFGSPAHAGIDHNPANFSFGLYRFPRTRGDRPFPIMLTAIRLMVPPHTRG